MTAGFSITTTSRFDRELKNLASKHDSLSEIFRGVLETLRSDPYNRSRQYPIKKLEAVSANDGRIVSAPVAFDSATISTGRPFA